MAKSSISDYNFDEICFLMNEYDIFGGRILWSRLLILKLGLTTKYVVLALRFYDLGLETKSLVVACWHVLGFYDKTFFDEFD